MPEIKHYGLWRSPISIESIFRQPSVPAYPIRHRNQVYWLQALPEEGGRIALMQLLNHKAQCLTPKEFNIRSRVHEYGGRCFCLLEDSVVFNNFADNRLYRQRLQPGAIPEPITPIDDESYGYADLVPFGRGGHVVAVTERKIPRAENRNLIVLVQIWASLTQPQELISGSDFYACPSVSPAADEITWLEWDHPNMPWDQTRLCQARIVSEQEEYRCEVARRVVDEPNCSICQPGYLSDGSLVYARDGDGEDWWNLYGYRDGKENKLTYEAAEFGEAHWQFGQQRWVQTGSNTIAAIVTNHLGDRILQIDLDQSREPVQLLEEAAICHLSYDDESLLCVATPEDRVGAIIEIGMKDNSSRGVGPQSHPLVDKGHSVPEPLEFRTMDGEISWGYFYHPYNPDYVAPENELPPLVVMVHGGPTSRTNRSFHPLRQYFTTLGFAVFDTNHRGSTGYGRQYRQRLLGGWGEIDTADIADCVTHLIELNKVEAAAVFIRGGSAGGYAVLRALTRYPELFAGGACYYGIGNLITLSEITHKFEARYTDNLVGEAFDPVAAQLPGSRYIMRSPIFEIQRLDSPLILFQGSQDNVVPADVSREVVSSLEQKGVPYEYTEYEEEGHGFRKLETRIDSLEKETKFFQNIIKQYHQS